MMQIASPSPRPPDCVCEHEHATCRGPAQVKGGRGGGGGGGGVETRGGGRGGGLCRVRQVGTVQRIRVRKHGHGLVERDPVFSEVGNSLVRVPLEHNSVYTTRLPQPSVPFPLRLSTSLDREVLDVDIRRSKQTIRSSTPRLPQAEPRHRRFASSRATLVFVEEKQNITLSVPRTAQACQTGGRRPRYVRVGADGRSAGPTRRRGPPVFRCPQARHGRVAIASLAWYPGSRIVVARRTA